MTGPARRERTAADVVAQFEQGDARGLSRALSWIEDADPRGRDVLRSVFARTGRSRLIGITGSPGAGKSTLVDRLAVRLARGGRRVAIIAVDPSSAFSGGALLGDRIRMHESTAIEGVYVRSMATRGHLGGLARATEDACDLLDAFGFDDVIIETVGVGQDEIEVVQVAHCCVVVLVPFMGDDVQTIKAGIMEIADAYVINKADREGADRMEAYLKAMLNLYDDGDRDIPIVRTVATRGEGIDEMIAAIEAVLRARTPTREKVRRVRLERRIAGLVVERLAQRVQSSEGSRQLVASAADRVETRVEDPHAAADRVLAALDAHGMPKGARVDHLGIAVRDAGEALKFWRDALGLTVAHEEHVASERVRVTMLPAGEARIELLEPVGDEGPVQAFLAKRGPGIHHACFEVSDIAASIERMKAAGVRFVGDAPRRGAGGKLVAFVHPSSASGVLVELSQPEREP